ncbi:sialate O-acetylesterase [Dyadobacter sp. CY312]|uniref:T9SS type A sorting domain-containing protein n=1 Tax=Dyadobacter sp. CY312 TaxID=2907303 RepID=UPI001F3EEF65|nr:sialate O-acetylesterase [Dyadobacter sp. CY312]MCE7041220.1 T9SS type A sorting domain-containing protein [Dyadobacter sp. CY312]
MKKIHSSLVWLCYTLSAGVSYAQTITFPSDRAVFQRDQANQAIITIAGYFTSCQDQVEARFVPIQSNPSRPAMGQPAPAGGGWQVIQNAATCGNFRGTMTVLGGWYRLEVRGIRNGSATPLSNIEHVGVGEVFLVSGQSNATGGDSNPTGPGATEDAVSSVHFRTNIEPYSNLKVDCPQFTHLNEMTTTAPFGNYAWCWGYFGDRLVKQLNVPVMIFNAGWSGSSIANWKQSIPTNGQTTAWFGYIYPQGLPFGNMRIALNNYIAQLGIRAILWHQGESDTKTETSRDAYRNDLKEVIEACRTASNKPNLAFVVSRASRYSFKKLGDVVDVSYTSADVIAAQNDVIGNPTSGYSPLYKVPYTFAGPETDPYYNSVYRHDNVHFAGGGLDSLAKFWATKLDNNFFQNATPYPAITPPNIAISHTGGTASLSAEAGWNAYQWLNETNCNDVQSTNHQWTVNAGIFRLKTIDVHNNTVLSPGINISTSSLPVTWIYFKGTGNSDLTANLSWATSEEDNTAAFELERAGSLSGFEQIASLTAAGNSSELKEYSFRDQLSEAGTYYYRIKQTDLDGQNSYSRVISVQVSGKGSIKLFPNPVSTNLTIQSEKSIQSVEVFNSLGLKVYSNSNPSNFKKLDMSRYQPGLYLFKINGESFRIVR